MRIATDTKNRPYARVSEVSAGTWLECDGGFTCLTEGERKQVSLSESWSDLEIECADGLHALNRQYKRTDYQGHKCEPFYLGLYLAK